VAQRFDQGWTCQCCTDHDSIVNASMTSAAVELPVRIFATEDIDGLWDKLDGAFCKGEAKRSLQQHWVDSAIVFGVQCPELSGWPNCPNVARRDGP
jgi:hypothetical protein